MVTISSVKARDIMQTEVVALVPSTPIKSAIETFEELHISGAPVVDESGAILGMLSAFDIAKSEHIKDDSIQADGGHYELLGTDENEYEPQSFDEVIHSLNDFSPPTGGRTTVDDWMSTGIVSVGPDCSLRTICRLMVKEHIHRVPVVKNGKLAGIISTLDIVRCIAGETVARAAEPATEPAGNSLRERRSSISKKLGSASGNGPRRPKAVHRSKAGRG